MFTILSISDSDKHREKVVGEYTKRLWRSLKMLNLKPSKNGNVQQIIAADTQNIITHLSKFSDAQKILLSKEGKPLDTMQLATLVRNKDSVFIIWWPYWLDENLLSKHLNFQISFWTITLPHGLAKVTLLEQLYRVWTIEQGKSYHY